MDFLYDKTFGWCFVLGEIVVIFIIFMVLHRRALRRHEELVRNDQDGLADLDGDDSAGQDDA